MNFVVHHGGAVLTATMTVVEGMVEAVAMMTTTVDLHVMMIASVVLMDVVTTTALATSIAMLHPAVKIATPVEETIAVVATSRTVAMVDDLATMRLMGSLRLRGMLEIPTVEVDPMTTILTIGTLVDRLRSANLLRCGALCEIMRPKLSTCSRASLLHFSFTREWPIHLSLSVTQDCLPRSRHR